MYQRIIWVSVLGFLSGSVLYAKLLPKLFYDIDIVACSEDGNPGTSNVFKYCGKKCGILTGILEFAKGFFPVALGNNMINIQESGSLFGFIILAPVLGHMFSVFHHWNGGMGVAPTFGTLIAVFLQCRMLIVLTGLYAVGRFAIKFRHQYQRTLAVFGCFAAAALLLEPSEPYRTTYFLIGCTICVKCIYTTVCSQRAVRT